MVYATAWLPLNEVPPNELNFLLPVQVDDTAAIEVVDVYGGQVDSRKEGHQVATKTCSLFIADYQHFSCRPGLKVLQVSCTGAAGELHWCCR